MKRQTLTFTHRLALAVGLLASLVAQAQITPKVEQFTLANGMTVIVKPDRRAPTAVHMLWVRVGSMDEVDGTSGVAHVLEHMMFKGTPDIKPGEFSRRVAALGGRENAFTQAMPSAPKAKKAALTVKFSSLKVSQAKVEELWQSAAARAAA